MSLGKYAVEQIRILKDMGFDLPISTTVSNNAYRDVGLGAGFERLAWKGFCCGLFTKITMAGQTL